MPQIGIGNLQNSYQIGGITWNKVPRVAQNVNVDYDSERTEFPVFQYNRGNDGRMHLSIHSGFAGVITNVHYTNGNFNNAKIHYNLQKAARDPGFSVDWAQVGTGGKKGFSQAMPTMQTELIQFLVQTQIDPTALQNAGVKDHGYRTAEDFKNQQVNWGKGRKTKKGVTFIISG